jgi:Fe-Mn family superoxide dismutase
MMTAAAAASAGLAMNWANTAAAQGAAGAGAAVAYDPLAVGYDAAKGEYVLPPLPYAPDALEAAIDAQTMQLHHQMHHAAYVKNLNAALKKLAEARQSGDYAGVQALSKSVAFNGGGHTLHTLFWSNMAPAGKGGAAEGKLLELINRDFSSLAAMQAQFSAAATAVEGGGWGILGYDLMAQRLLILQGENQQKLTTWGMLPLLVLDVWEHAYYLRYQNRRAAYVEAWWKVVNWTEVSRRLAGLTGGRA